MSAVTYDMQKLDEAVSALSVGTKTLQERLRDAIIPLTILKSGEGLHNKSLSAELDRILLGVADENMTELSDDQARSWARSIVELQSKNWHDAVWKLEDQINSRN